MEVRTITNSNPEALDAAVNQLLREGWKIYGNLVLGVGERYILYGYTVTREINRELRPGLKPKESEHEKPGVKRS